MAGQRITASISVALAAATANEVMQIKAAANQRVLLRRLVVTGTASAGGTDAATTGRLTLSTANFGTFTGTVVKTKVNPSNGETIQTTFSGNTTGGTPSTTPTDLGQYFAVNPQSGIVLRYEPPLEIPGGQAINVELTNAGTPTHRVFAEVEE